MKILSSHLITLFSVNVRHRNKVLKVSTAILAHYDKVQLQDKGHNSERYIYGVMPPFN